MRLVSGAAVLTVLAALSRRGSRSSRGPRARGSWTSAAWLFAYAVPFSFAYRTLDAGAGALILFGAVQTTMLTVGLLGGERPLATQWLGLAVAVGGLVYLVLPGAGAPGLTGFALMATAGVAWGVYSLRGRGVRDPLGETAGNFARSVPMVAVVVAAFALRHAPRHDADGLALAVASGALASGVGYSIWYAALPGLQAVQAASVQLAVPVLAALGGVVFMAESLTPRLAVASLLILGGVALSLRRPVRAAEVNS